MMTSFAEQRRFIHALPSMSLAKILSVRALLLKFPKRDEKEEEMLRAIETELNARD